MEFKITVDISQVAEKLNSTRELLETKLTECVKAISTDTHAFIVNKAAELGETKRDMYLGTRNFGKDAQRKSSPHPSVNQEPQYLRWIEVSKGLWIVELDPKAAWIEEGRGPTSMATEQWLLKPGSKGLKKAKDGSTYKAIPFTHQSTGQRGHTLSKVSTGSPGLKSMLEGYIRSGASDAKLSALAKEHGVGQKELKKLSKLGKGGLILGADKKPVIGHIASLNIPSPDSRAEGFSSKPRSAEDAAKSGLKPHGGIFFLQGASVYQRKNEKGKVSRETVVFRVVSSKHRAEGRWMAPAQPAFNAFKEASEFAQKRVDEIIKAIGEEIRRVG